MPFESDFVLTRAFGGTAGCPQTAEEKKRKNGFTLELIPPKIHRSRLNRFIVDKFAYSTFDPMTTIYFHKIHANGGIARIDDYCFLIQSQKKRIYISNFFRCSEIAATAWL